MRDLVIQCFPFACLTMTDTQQIMLDIADTWERCPQY